MTTTTTTTSWLFLGCFLLVTLSHVTRVEAYTVELSIVVDDHALIKWRENSGKSTEAELREELDSIFVEVTELYASLDHYHIPVKFAIKNLTMGAQNVVSSPYGIIGTEGLGQFRSWLFERKSFEAGDWDIALLLTGLDVVGDSKALLGFGQIDRVCTDWGVGMVEFLSEDYGDAFVIAHEIGHILGANHDGFRDQPGIYCDPKKGFIMTPSVATRSINHFHFSYCSYNYFYTALAAGHWDCLKGDDDGLTVTGKRLGELEGADETCRREINKDAMVYRPEYFVYGDRVCTSLVCSVGAGETKREFSPQGLYCGKNKQCIQGKCVETKRGRPNVPDHCPFGDAPNIDYKGYRSCDDLPLEYCGVMKEWCCKRCASQIGLHDADDACQKITKSPVAMLLRQKYNYNGYGDRVCTHLACTLGLKDGKVTVHWGTAPDGMACGMGKRCHNSRCLSTQTNPPTIPDHCPFGDQAWSWWTCHDVISKSQDPTSYCNDPNYGRYCCAYCQHI